MKAYLLVEGDSDRAVFQRLLPPKIRSETVIVPAGGRSNITSKARSLMLIKQRPLALVADADVVEPSIVEQRLESLEDLIGSANVGIPFKVILAVPEIASWFFVVPDAIERLSGKKLSTEQRDLGYLRPKEVFKQLVKVPGDVSFTQQLTQELTDMEIQEIRGTKPMRELIEFLTEQIGEKTEPQTV